MSQKGGKNIFLTPPPPYLKVWTTAPPPYLKVWIRLRNGCLEEGDYALRQLSFKFSEFFISATVKIPVILYNVHIREIRRIFNVEVCERKPMGLKRVHAPNLSQAISCKSILTYTLKMESPPGTSYNTLYGKALPGRGNFFRLQV